MEESTVFVISEMILGKIGSAAALVNDKDELKGLENTILGIKYMLIDAEKKQIDNPKFKTWLEKLENSLYEADNLLDAVYNGATNINKVEEWQSQKLSPTIKSIKGKLDAARDDASRFHLEERREAPHKVSYRDEHFMKIDDRVEAINQLLSKERNNIGEEHVPIVAIVGYGGVGKTALARKWFTYIFFDKPHCFELKFWVEVPYDFDIRSLVEKIMLEYANNITHSEAVKARDAAPPILMACLIRLIDEQDGFTKKVTESLDRSSDIAEHKRKMEELVHHLDESELREELRKAINGKRVLLVLDDIWNADSQTWRDFKNLLSDAGSGSRILITTRSKLVANNITSRIEDTYRLSDLDEHNSRKLLESSYRDSPFDRVPEPINSKIMEIVEKCGGNPFALSEVGKKLKSMNNLETIGLSHFLDTEIPQLLKEKILPSLKHSYDILPPHLKPLFAYCGVFPQQSEIDVKTLIHLWMAQGWIYASRGKRMVDVGYEYFQDLCQSYFLFDQVEVDPENGTVTKCKMPKLIQDLAVLVAGTWVAALKEHEKHSIDRKTQHVSFYYHLGSSWTIPTSFLHAKRIRTFILPSQLHWETEGRLSHSTFETIISNCKRLRTLDLHNTGVQKVPKSIDKLKYLRYLDLSQNSAIKSLPNSITNIQYLMTLKLSSCYGLEELPRDMKKLVHLKHLEIDWCYNLTHMPPGLGQLTQLETLSEFVVRNDTGSAKLNELAGLTNLRGELKIQNLGNYMDTKADDANLEGKDNLKSLTLAWVVNIGSEEGAERTLQGLKPHSNLKELALFGYWGTPAFPDWLSSLRNLVKFSLQKCKCRYLPPLSQLSSLKVLTVDEMDNLEYISNESDQFFLSSSSTLEELRLTELPSLVGWWRGDVSKTATSLPSFPHLSKLIIEDCPKLRSMPLYHNLEEWLVLDNTSLETFIQTINDGSSSSLSQLRTLSIVAIKDTSFDDDIKWERLTSLRFLRFDYLPKLKELPEGLKNVTTLEELHIWRCDLKTLPGWIKNLESLKRIGLSTCPYLESLPCDGFDPSLETLKIVDCPILFQRCQKQTGADWNTVQGIKKLLLQQPQSSLIFKLSKEENKPS